MSTSVTVSALAFTNQSSALAQASVTAGKAREYYEIEVSFGIRAADQADGEHVSDGLIPALNRLGIAPVGAFHLDIARNTYAVSAQSSTNLETLATSELRLAQYPVFMKVAELFWNMPATAPAFQRIESSLLIAFEGWPNLIRRL